MNNAGRNGHASTGVLDDDSVLDAREIMDEEGEPRVAPEPAATPDLRKRRRVPVAFVVLTVFVCAGVVAFLAFTGVFSGKKAVNVRVPAATERQKEVTRGADADQGISNLAASLRTDAPVLPAQGSPITQSPALAATPAPVFGTTPYDPAAPITAAPAPDAPTAGVAGTVQSGAAAPASAAPSADGTARGAPSPRRADFAPPEVSEPAAQSSSYFFNPPDSKPQSASGSNAGAGTPFKPVSPFDKGNGAGGNAASSAPVKPPFGASLPVRVLGAIYTLRSVGYVRLELTRAVRGEGWSLQRGTQFVGKLSGSENDRAFINLLGFIDPATRKLVRVGGQVKGVDGGDGLKGSRKRIGNRWLSALKQVGLPLGTAWLGGRGGGTQVIMPASSAAGVGLSGGRVTEFVAVKAGTLGSVMITDLPEVIQGAQPDVDGLDPRAGGEGLSEDEMIELMTGGDDAAIRASFARMNARQRQLALAALKEPK